MDEETRKLMTECYYDGGVSRFQTLEFGKEWPSIKKFLDFSERYAGVPFRSLSNFGGLEFVFAYEAHFEKIDVTGDTLAACMDGDVDAIRNVCRKILASLDCARELKERGEAHLVSRGVVVNSTAVKAFILAALDARERYQKSEVIPELYFLLAQVLFPGEPDAEKARKNSELKEWASLVAWGYHHKHGRYPSYRKLANLFRVAPSTISRLYESQADFEDSARRSSFGGKDASAHPALKGIYPYL
jgi:DNA-binding MarR family transcriptional regulator